MTTLYWSMAMNAAQFATVVVLIVVIVHYAREGAHNAGKLEVHESLLTEAKDEAQKERIRQL
jgi:hypothetical protein